MFCDSKPRLRDGVNQKKERVEPIKPHYTKGVLAKYASLVSSAAGGAVTSPK